MVNKNKNLARQKPGFNAGYSMSQYSLTYIKTKTEVNIKK